MRAAFTLPTASWLAVVMSLSLGCFGEPNPVTLDQPIAIVGGNFRSGSLPGDPPETEIKTDPQITSFEFAAYALRPGQQHIAFIGRVGEGASAVAIALEGVGTGYWVHTTGAVDPQYPGERIYDFTLEVGLEVPAGPRRLLVVAIDDQGHAGTQSALNICITSALPDNGHACDPQQVLPAAVIELAWSEDVDLDLSASDPGGLVVSRQDPVLYLGDQVLARLSTDSNAGCTIDGNRVEHIVWPELPGEGLWSIYANLYDPCGHTAVSYRVTQYQRREGTDGSSALEAVGEPIVGRFVRGQANGDGNVPVFLTQLNFETTP